VDVRLVTPLALLFGVTALLPLAVFALRLRRLGETRRALRLAQPSLRSYLPLVIALAAVPALLGLAAAQPVVETTKTVRQRTDVQAFVVLDVSRSMLASRESGAPTRLDRAKDLAVTLRRELPDIPFGVASLTDRVLPHLFPTSDVLVFDATLERAVRIENPPPATYATIATKLGSLREIPEQSYFPPSAKRRVVVVLTDGESEMPEGDLAAAFEREPRIRTVFVRVWGADEAIYETGVAEGGYSPDPRGEAITERAAELVGGTVVGQDDPRGLLAAVREAVGRGETVARSESSGRLALMPWVTLLALVPLAFLLVRRNFWWAPRLPRLPRRAAGSRREGAAKEAAKVPAPRGVAQPG
jgi:hypothetical protein